jgi:hypothetical protein
MTKLLLTPLLCSLLAIACQTGGDDIQARALELESSPGLRVTISAATLDEATIHALADHLKSGPEDHGAAMVRVKHEDGAGSSVEIELFGGDLPQGDIPAQIKAQFPALATATITSASIPAGEGPGPGLPIIDVDHDLSPAEAEQQIRDQLAADGVDGDVKVNIVDGPDGQRRIEVGVEKQAVH